MISPAAAVRTAVTSSSSGLVLRMKPAQPASVAVDQHRVLGDRRQHHDLCVRSQRLELGDRVDPEAVRQAVVEQDDVRLRRDDHRPGLGQGGRRADDGQVLLGGQRQPQAVGEHVVVVHDQQAHRRRRRRSGRRSAGPLTRWAPRTSVTNSAGQVQPWHTAEAPAARTDDSAIAPVGAGTGTSGPPRAADALAGTGSKGSRRGRRMLACWRRAGGVTPVDVPTGPCRHTAGHGPGWGRSPVRSQPGPGDASGPADVPPPACRCGVPARVSRPGASGSRSPTSAVPTGLLGAPARGAPASSATRLVLPADRLAARRGAAASTSCSAAPGTARCGCAGAAATSSGVPSRDHRAAARAALGAHVDDPVGGLDDVEVVLDHEHRVALVDQAAAARRSSLRMSSKCRPVVGSSST